MRASVALVRLMVGSFSGTASRPRIEAAFMEPVNGCASRFRHLRRHHDGHVGAAPEALLVKVKVLVVRARRRAAARADGAPVAALEDGAVAFAFYRARPLVDVARRVVNAEGAPARRPRARRLALPDVVDLGERERAVANGEQ